MQVKFFNYLFAFVFIICSVIFCENTNAQHVINDASIDSLIEHHLKESKMAGIAAAMIFDQKVVWMKGYGWADKENKIPFTPHTIMNIASISKTFTGVCMMRLVEENKLSLDENINKYLPFKVVNPNFPNEKITLRMIASHSSSLADRYPFYSDHTYIYGSDSQEPLGEFLQNYFVRGGKYYSDSNFYKAKPGTYWDYSNIAAALAGYIVEIKSGKKLNEYSKQLIFKPLGMNSTGWFLSEVDISKHAKLYHNQGDSSINVPLYGSTTYPDGGLRTSVADLSKFFIALLNDGVYNGIRLLKKETLNEMQRLRFTESNKPANFDVKERNEAIFWRTKNDGAWLGHGGTDPGLKTLMLTDVNKKAGVILFTNTEDDNSNRTGAFFKLFGELLKHSLMLSNSSKNHD
jgi:CubicO group peptidase (beta-lactamase class C family)